MRRFCYLAFACLFPVAVSADETPSTTPSPSATPSPAVTAATPLPTPTTSVTLTVVGKNVVLTLPEGTCAYDRTQSADAKLLGFLEKGNEGLNQVLLAFSDCDDLAALRRGESAGKGYYGQILSEYSKQALADSSSRADYVSAMAKEYNEADADKGANAGKDRVKAVLDSKADVGEVKMLGIVNQDPDFVQAGIIQSVPGDDGSPRKIDGVVTLTKLGVPVSINLYHSDDNPAAWAALNTQATAYARKLVALNVDSHIAHADERGESPGRESVIIAIGAAILGLVALFLYRRKRAMP